MNANSIFRNPREGVYARRAWCVLLLLGLAWPLWADDKAAEQGPTVSLTLDYGDGVQKTFTQLSWRSEMTIADALQQAKEHPRGITFEKRGSGSNTLLTQIDDLKNGTGDKYWIFFVNQREGEESYAVVKLNRGDAVLWKFKGYP